MKQSNFFRTVAFILILAFSSSITFSQSVESINERIGGGSKPIQSDSKNNNTFLYIAAGAVLVGLLVWKVILDRKEPKKKSDDKNDSTKVSFREEIYDYSINSSDEVSQIQNKVPIDLILGLSENNHAGLEKRFIVGLRIKL